MPRPTTAVIDLRALRGNLRVARARAGSARLMAVIKADAYGHGLRRVLPALDDADALALLEIDAAAQLRDLGVSKPLVLLEGFFDERELEICAALSLSVVVHHADQVEMLLRAKLARAVEVHLKLNSGMNRLGFLQAAFVESLDRLGGCAYVSRIVSITHFADAEGPRGVDWQLDRLREVSAPRRLPVSAANSAALLRYPQSVGDWVRPGIMLYGASPLATAADDLGLAPVMTLRSRIIATQALSAGDSVGYGCRFVAPAPMRIGVVACGYGDGYPRHAPGGTPVLVDGRPTGTIGLVSMDMLTVDLTALPAAGTGSDVVLWGRGLPVELVASSSGTVSYELLCALKPRVPVSVEG